MLTEKQFEVIGRLALAFNDLEMTISYHLRAFMSCAEETVSTLIVDECQTFNRKTALLIKILRALTKQYEDPALGTRLNALIGLLEKAKEIARKRNLNVHAVGAVNAENLKEILVDVRHRTYRYADEGNILRATDEAKDLAMELHLLGLTAGALLWQLRRK